MSSIRKKKQKRNSRFLKNTPCPVLIEKQKQAARMLFEGERVQDVANTLCVHRTTVWRWKDQKPFKLEWQRLAHNEQRRMKRLKEKYAAEREAYWEDQRQIYEELLQREIDKCDSKPTKAVEKAWKAYENALFRGYSLSEILGSLLHNKPLKIKFKA